MFLLVAGHATGSLMENFAYQKQVRLNTATQDSDPDPAKNSYGAIGSIRISVFPC